MKNIVELEQMIDNEITSFQELEQNLEEKKQALVVGDMEKIKTLDEKIIQYEEKINEITKKRFEFNKKHGSPDLTLSSLIKTIPNTDSASRLEAKREKINEIATNIEKQNGLIMELIKHSLNLIEGSIGSIASAMNPMKTKTTAYDQTGKTNTNQGSSHYSSIVEEV